tara:strand:- start:9792 stop:11912 length:2121 start_codon:yes stop_codon:yes gene_type:complete
MSVFSINETLSGLQIDGPKVFYDFSSFSGVSQINSVADGDSIYSGSITNGDAQFTGNVSGSGFFRNQYITIQNTDQITSAAATILFSQEKTGVGPGTIFSNLNEPSGFELGITTANKVYYKNYINGSPNYVTLESYPVDKNIYAFTMDERGAGSIGRLNFKAPAPKPQVLNFINSNTPTTPQGDTAPIYYSFTKKNIIVPDHTVSNGSEWKIGSGDFLYSGYMDYFLYFDRVIGDDVLRKLARAIHVETTFVPPVTGLIQGVVTGYTVTVSNTSGIIGNEFTVTGKRVPSGNYEFFSGTPLTGAVEVSGEVFIPKTGISKIVGTNLLPQTVYRRVTNLSFTHTLTGGLSVSGLGDYYSSGSYWLFSGNSGTFNGENGEGPEGTIFGITGFDVTTKTGDTSGVGVDMMEASGVSGLFYSGYQFAPLRAPDITYTGTGGYFHSGPNEDHTYFSNALSVLGPPDPNYIYELYYDITGARDLEQDAVNISSSTYNKTIASLTGSLPLSGVNLYINGVATFTGFLTKSTNEFNFPVAEVTSGFALEGTQAFTTLDLTNSHKVVYDSVPNRHREQLTITNTSQYTSAPFSEITEVNNDIFFNGVKLVSGVDYTFAGGFRPTGNITGGTGVYFTYAAYSGEPITQKATGYLTDAISVYADQITPFGYALFFNGVRQPTDKIIEHGANSDLISGVDLNVITGTVYRMVNGITQT